MFLYLTDY